MKQIAAASAAFVCVSTAAFAGLERVPQSMGILFEEGNYVELSFGHVKPDVSGSVLGGALQSGDMAPSYNQIGFAIKHDFTEKLSAAFIHETPFGADVAYPSGTGYPFQAATADLKARSYTGVLRYKFNETFSAHAGLRYQTLEAVANIPAIASYTADGGRDGAMGYLIGVAYEKPDIALRVALTYQSEITHKLPTDETSALTGGATLSSTTTTTTPQSVNLDFQTGIAKDTLLFGGVRWTEWTKFDVSPTHYVALVGSPLVFYNHDVFTYTLGIGRRFNENWAGSIAISHEKSNGGLMLNLGPKDGKTSITVGARYTKDNLVIAGGLNYTMIGDANTNTGTLTGTSDFTDNSAVGVGFKIGYRY